MISSSCLCVVYVVVVGCLLLLPVAKITLVFLLPTCCPGCHTTDGRGPCMEVVIICGEFQLQMDAMRSVCFHFIPSLHTCFLLRLCNEPLFS